MKNYVQPGDTLGLPAPYDVSSGGGALVGEIFGVAVADVKNGALGQFKTLGVFDLPKVSAQAWTVGALVYWDNTAKKLTTAGSGNKPVGVATEAAANPSDIGRARLNGAFGV